MTSDLIQTRYDELDRVAARFAKARAASDELHKRIARCVAALEHGGWQGRGADAFFAEMRQTMDPAMQRLLRALDEGRSVTLQIKEILRAAEEEAARPFHGNDADTAAGASMLGAGATDSSHGPQPDASATAATALQASGPFKIGAPQHPTINHDNGFLDSFPPREPTVGERLKLLEWRAKLEASEAFRPGLVDANAAYRHFLNGDGADRQFSYERYIENDASGKTAFDNIIADAQKHAETLSKDRGSFSMTSDTYPIGGADARFPYPATENWQKTIGGHSVWTSADVEAMGTGKDKTYTMTITLHAEDRYNFNPGAADIATGIPDSDNGVFEVTGLAHQYTNYSEVKRTVTWKEGEAKNPIITDSDTSRNRSPSDNRRLRNRL